ncbi:MAG: sigma-70 family RNA polymerase sigma factor [Oscillospiraceae bacterium]|nr:sigma-70 family RNA polymerase sigma factor [Oscillospiraceae bacterium]
MQRILSDNEILFLFTERDERAIAETARAYGGLCKTIARNILGNEQDAEECVNDMLMQAWRSIPPEPQHLAAYLSTITRNLALNRRERQQTLRRGGGEIPAALDELSELIADRETVEQVSDSRALTAAIAEFLRGTSAKNRRVFLLRYYSVMPVQEIADTLGISSNTVKTILRRTREKLRVYLEKEGFL